MSSIPRRQMTKPLDGHWCSHSNPAPYIPMQWRPAEVIATLYPTTADVLLAVAPAVVAYCPLCKELWIVPAKDAA
jgi:hypothetical protein